MFPIFYIQPCDTGEYFVNNLLCNDCIICHSKKVFLFCSFHFISSHRLSVDQFTEEKKTEKNTLYPIMVGDWLVE